MAEPLNNPFEHLRIDGNDGANENNVNEDGGVDEQKFWDPEVAAPATPTPAPEEDSRSEAPSTGTHPPRPQLTPAPMTRPQLGSTVERMQALVDRDTERLFVGDITELPPHTIRVMDHLFAFNERQESRPFRARSHHTTVAFPPPDQASVPAAACQAAVPAAAGRVVGPAPVPAEWWDRGPNTPGWRSRDRQGGSSRPRCTYGKCKKPLGHTLEKCFQRKRDQERHGQNPDAGNNKKARREDGDN